ncbi:MAG: YciI family protein [Oscillospiraceae bacterium]|nr:YciI family protein [Oscillospiraceae bacterium]
MYLKKGNRLYVRVDTAGEKDMTPKDIEDHLTYVKNIAEERYFIGGAFSNINGGLCLFESDNLEEAQKIAQNDPIIQRGFYQCEVYEWELMVLSEEIDK